MALFKAEERGFAEAISGLLYCNPFQPERIERERTALGPDFVAAATLWHPRGSPDLSLNEATLQQRAEALAESLRARLADGSRAAPAELSLYEDLVFYVLYYRYEPDFFRLIQDRRAATARVGFYGRFLADLDLLLVHPGLTLPSRQDAAHLFACFFQIRRAFHYIFANILGGSMPAVRLRAAVWQSIFTRDMKRYRRSLYQRMGDIATLITGPSGTGKELVAQAIGHARYIPFDADKQAFTEDFAGAFYALNLSALSTPLIESELFGHRRGSFTGAVENRVGWLEVCPPLGTVFLDEIGEVDVAVQVKLLRVLQTRRFQRLGDTDDRAFHGKIIAATNRALGPAMRAGQFREDFYYRLCSDLIVTPSLEEQLLDAPGERRAVVLAIAQRVAGEAEADYLADETELWIDSALGRGYRWPGNFRELEQCIRNIMIRGEYQPPHQEAGDAVDAITESVRAGTLTADELLRRYCTLVYARTGSYQETARRLGIDRRTVRDKIDAALLADLAVRSRQAPRQERA